MNTYLQRFKTEEQRFWEKVNKTNKCWIWTGAKRDGYGLFRYNKKCGMAHIFSAIIHQIPNPDNKPCVLHTFPFASFGLSESSLSSLSSC